MWGQSRLVQASLIAAHLLLPLAAFAVSQSRPNDWSARNVARVVVFSEAGMLCIWAGMSRQPWVRRLAGALLGLAACWTLLRFQEQKQTSLMLIECLLFPGAATLVLALAIQSSPTRFAPSDPQADRMSLWQFSVGQLLIFTTMVAVLLVLVQQFLKGNIRINPRLVVAEGSQISVVMMTWAAIGRRWRKLRLITGILVASGVGLVVQSFMSDSWFWLALENIGAVTSWQIWEDLLSIPAATLVEALLTAATVMVFVRNPLNPGSENTTLIENPSPSV